MRAAPDAYFADTPAGLFTAAGLWYRTREADLKKFAAPALAGDNLRPLLENADRLVGLPRTSALWAAPLLLLVLPWTWAAAATLALVAALTLVLPALANPTLARVLRPLDPPLGQMLLNVFVLSLLAAQNRYAAVWTGLALFVVLRWGLLTYALRPLANHLYAPGLADRVLRALVVRTALQRGVALPEIQAMETSLLNTLHRR